MSSIDRSTVFLNLCSEAGFQRRRIVEKQTRNLHQGLVIPSLNPTPLLLAGRKYRIKKLEKERELLYLGGLYRCYYRAAFLHLLQPVSFVMSISVNMLLRVGVLSSSFHGILQHPDTTAI